MQELIPIYDASLLTQSKVYQIEGTLYHFLYRDSYSSVDHPQYIFRPMPGQKKRADLKLNKNKLGMRVKEVSGMFKQTSATVSDECIQLSLL